MELKINIVEAAAELAEVRVNNYFRYSTERIVYTEEENGDTIYTDAAQEVFNAEYDRIFDKLVNCKVTPIPNLFNCKTIFFEDAVEELAKKQVERHMKQKYKGKSEEEISDKTWGIGDLNEMIWTPEARGVFNKAKEYYEMHLTQFEV